MFVINAVPFFTLIYAHQGAFQTDVLFLLQLLLTFSSNSKSEQHSVLKPEYYVFLSFQILYVP